MDWSSAIQGFKAYISLERSLSKNSVEAYVRDAEKLQLYAIQKHNGLGPLMLHVKHLEGFLKWLYAFGLEERSQARILSGIKAFYKYLLVEDLLDDDPTELLEGPKLIKKIPDVLTLEEIEAVMQAIDLSEDFGHRNRAMLEVLYACGLRVSELVNLKLSLVHADLGLVRVIGKGNKERIVPIGENALQHIAWYVNGIRAQLPISKGHEDYLFLNKFGKKMSRVMIFYIIKATVEKAGIKKTVSPHTFRHSFATHLVEGGADLRAVQEMLGHESITTTEMYTHLDTSFLKATILQYHPRNRT